MKTSLTIFPCVLGSAFPIIRVCPGLSFATKRIGPPCCTLFTFFYLLLVTNYPITKLSVTTYFSTCREYLAGNRLSFPSAPRWVRHSYLSKGLREIPYTCGSSLLRLDLREKDLGTPCALAIAFGASV